jgi:anti-anti-sigma regulatory factor
MLTTPGTVINLEGHFDQSAALRLRVLLMKSQTPATIDFSHVAEFDDATLALLSVNLIVLKRRGRAVTLRGLRDHQLRLLDHLGVTIAPDGAVKVLEGKEMPFTD